jgi:hypothetical protein
MFHKICINLQQTYLIVSHKTLEWVTALCHGLRKSWPDSFGIGSIVTFTQLHLEYNMTRVNVYILYKTFKCL